MKKGSKKVSNVTRTLNFFRDGDDNEVKAVLFLMGPIINERRLEATITTVGTGLSKPVRKARRVKTGPLTMQSLPARRLNGADEVETHKERVAHALAATQGEE
jgi:hypothetical protein